MLAIEDAVANIGALALCDDVARQRGADYQSSASSGSACRVLALSSSAQVGTDANTPLLAYRMYVAQGLDDNASDEELWDAYYSSQTYRLFQRLDLHMAMFDPIWDYDFSCAPFTDLGYSDGAHVRGGLPYRRPLGWKRFALDVEDKFERPPAWLGDSNEMGEWAVAYHGTSAFAVRPIARDGLRFKGIRRAHGALYGEGVYCTPHPEVAAFFAEAVPLDDGRGKRFFQVVFQCRVRPGRFKRHDDPIGEFWVVRSEADVRPYGMLLGECDECGSALIQVRRDADDW